MRLEKYLVTASLGGSERSFSWNPETSLVLDRDRHTVLASAGDEFQLRFADKVVANQKVSSEFQGSTRMQASGVSVVIKKLRPIPPAFQSTTGTGPLRQFLIYYGEGALLKNAFPSHTAHIAYSKGNPIFTVEYADPNDTTSDCLIKPLRDGVKLKLKGENAVVGEINVPWKVKTSELLTATVIRGSRWWRFGRLHLSETIIDGSETPLDDEAKILRSTVISVVLGLTTLFGILWLLPSTKQEIPERIEGPPVVRVHIPRAKKVNSSSSGGGGGALATQPSSQPEESRPKFTQAPKVAQEPVKIPERMSKSRSTSNTQAKTPPSSTVANRSTPPTSSKQTATESRENKLRQDRANSLRAAFSGALSLVGKDSAKSGSTSTAPSGRDLFSGGGGGQNALAPSQFQAGSVTGGGKVEGLLAKGGGTTGVGQGDRARGLGQGPALKQIDIGDPSVDEGLTKEEVGQVIHQHMGEVRACHESAILYKPNIGGKVQIQFVINPQGRVKSASVQNSTVPDSFLQECILKKIPGWTFPKPRNGINVSVSYPFLFKTLRRE